ncbi:MAG: hypothetical protein JW832_16230 [Deltaproteobacteria bacterium]|nr:hypothetical protein [Deltaproteobacteria bacterium]
MGRRFCQNAYRAIEEQFSQMSGAKYQKSQKIKIYLETDGQKYFLAGALKIF